MKVYLVSDDESAYILAENEGQAITLFKEYINDIDLEELVVKELSPDYEIIIFIEEPDEIDEPRHKRSYKVEDFYKCAKPRVIGSSVFW